MHPGHAPLTPPPPRLPYAPLGPSSGTSAAAAAAPKADPGPSREVLVHTVKPITRQGPVVRCLQGAFGITLPGWCLGRGRDAVAFATNEVRCSAPYYALGMAAAAPDRAGDAMDSR